jgi:hypothetical protein
MREILIAALATGVLASGAAAQASPRKPGPEHARIGHFAGQWTYEGEVKPSPMGKGGKIKVRETCEWFAGGFHLVCRSEGDGPMGPGKGQSTMGYDPGEKTYTYHAVNSFGDGFFVRGNVSGPVWTWNNESKVEGKLMKFRATITEHSPTSHTFKLESSSDGGPWEIVEEGRSTKVGR